MIYDKEYIYIYMIRNAAIIEVEMLTFHLLWLSSILLHDKEQLLVSTVCWWTWWPLSRGRWWGRRWWPLTACSIGREREYKISTTYPWLGESSDITRNWRLPTVWPWQLTCRLQIPGISFILSLDMSISSSPWFHGVLLTLDPCFSPSGP